MYGIHIHILIFYVLCKFISNFVMCKLSKYIDVYCSGWMFKLEVKNMDELKALMDEKAYAEYLENKDTHDK